MQSINAPTVNLDWAPFYWVSAISSMVTRQGIIGMKRYQLHMFSHSKKNLIKENSSF